MEKFTTLTGTAVPMLRQNIDTDTIIPIDKMIMGDRHSLGPVAFFAWRYLADGSENPDFVLNQPRFREAAILLAGENFGCGSSREGAVWAIKGLGIRCVIAPSFGGIFQANCFQNSVLPVVLPPEQIEAFAGQATGTFTVDLEASVIRDPAGDVVPFRVDPARRHALLHGLDDIATTLQHEPEIAAFQREDRKRRPWIYL